MELQSSAEILNPAEVVSLNMKTQSNSSVALSAIDKAIYGVTRRAKRALKKVK